MASCGNSCTGQCKYACTGCSSNCQGTCQGSASSNSARRSSRTSDGRTIDTRTCNGTCWATCGTSCSSSGTDKRNGDGGGCSCGKDCAGCGGCRGKCSGCSGDCTGCSGSCGGNCVGTCTSGCSYTCKGKCTTSCKGTCKEYCLGGCASACTGNCNHLCNKTCVSDMAETAFAYLNKYAIGEKELDFLEDEEARYILGMLQEEGRRRVLKKTGTYTGKNHSHTTAETLTKEEEIQIGIRNDRGQLIVVRPKHFADDTRHITRFINLLTSNAGKSASGLTGSEGDKINKSTGLSLIKRVIEAYNQEISVNSTYEKDTK